jgi:hypothetical protein
VSSSSDLSRAALLAALGASACGSLPGVASPVVFDACRPTTIVAALDASSEERAGIAEAIALWSAVGGPPLELAPAAASVPAERQVLPLAFQSAAPVSRGLYRADRGDILINRELVDPRARAITVAHELGHAFGLAHESARRSLMNPGNLVVPPGEIEARLIRERRGSCDEEAKP